MNGVAVKEQPRPLRRGVYNLAVLLSSLTTGQTVHLIRSSSAYNSVFIFGCSRMAEADNMLFLTKDMFPTNSVQIYARAKLLETIPLPFNTAL